MEDSTKKKIACGTVGFVGGGKLGEGGGIILGTALGLGAALVTKGRVSPETSEVILKAPGHIASFIGAAVGGGYTAVKAVEVCSEAPPSGEAVKSKIQEKTTGETVPAPKPAP